ncbi:putative membrane protein [Mycobacterium frederiksbergense]|uniref:Membrane protein n=1 Tax=Mycolicibacterium frederiksbergense TaxID=117567 RepID=A0ABT6L569_9MYCO|nr:hypothetical protein [Mycolicibacterium frederiksbergense]MDH6198048.1 putative membrane protein [Mycolicibacterium frederiksbergense]
MAKGNNCKLVKLVGLGLAGVGVSHFVKPELFESITKPAFPNDTQKHIYTNGGIETAIGLGLVLPKTRKLAKIGTLGYLAYLAGNAVRNR